MANYVMEHSGEELDEAIGYVLDNYKDVSPVTARAQDVVFGKIIVTPEGPVMGTYQGVIPPASWRKTASGESVEISDGMADWPLHGIEAEIRPVQDLHGYESPWPAGGGKNKFNKDDSNSVVEGYITSSSFSNSNRQARTVYVPISPNTTYTVSKMAGQRFQVATSPYAPTDGAILTSRINNSTGTSITITSGEGDAYLWAWVYLGGTDTGTLEEMLSTVQIESGSTATSYTPYSNICPISASESVTVTQNGASAVSVEFPETPGTVYGGVMDFKTGVLTVTHRYRTLNGSESWTAWSGSAHSVRVNASDMMGQETGDPSDSWMAADGAACDSLPVVAANAGAPCLRFYKPTQRIYVYWAESIDPSITSAATWRAWLAEHPITVVYPLAEPVTYQLAPQEMPLLAAGTNSFAADTGGVTVTYYSVPDDPVNPSVQSLQSSPAALSMAAPTADPMDEPEEVEDE